MNIERYASATMNTERLTTTQAIAEWLRWARAGGLAPASIATYRPYLTDFFTTFGVEYFDVNPEHLLRYSERLNQRGSASALSAYRALSHFWKWLRANGLTDKNPVEFMPYTSQVMKVPTVFTREQLLEVFTEAKARDTRAELILKFLYYTGARRSEAHGVNLDDLGSSSVRLAVTKRKPGGVQKERLIPLGTDAQEALGQIPTEISRKDGDARAFPWHWRLTNIWCEGLTQDLKFHVHPHKFRATFATNMLRAGKDIRTVSELLGHSSIQTTMRYLAVVDEWKVDAVSAL